MQGGNVDYAAAAPVNQSFQVDAATFTLSSNPSSATVSGGQSAVFTFTVTPQGSYTGMIDFSCSGLPAVAKCSFSPATLTPDTSTMTTTLTITTAAQTALLMPGPSSHRPGLLNATWLVLPGMLLGMVAIAAPKRRKLLSCCLLLLVAGGCVLQSACGGTGKTVTPAVTPPGTYTITVTGAAGSTQQTVALTVTVS